MEQVVISGGIASGKTAHQIEQFHELYPEWANLISFVAPAACYRVLAVSKLSLTVDFVEPHWRLTVHPQAPDYWVAEVHDLDECKKHPEIYIAPLSHAEGEGKITVAGSALERALIQASDTEAGVADG